MTTNDGTPTLATIVPWAAPIDAPRRDDRERPIATSPGQLVAAAGQLELGDRHRREAAQVADREVDLAEQEDEDDAVREHGRARPSG